MCGDKRGGFIPDEKETGSSMVTALAPTARLQRNALGLPQIVASTLANIAPAMGFFFGFGLIVGGAGVAAPLTLLAAMVAILFLTNTLAEFSRYQPSTGSFVTFIGMAFGPAAGAASALFVMTGYAVAASSVVVIAGGWAHDALAAYLGISIPWQVLSVIAIAIVGSMVARGIGFSTRWAAIFFYFELVLLLVGAVAMLVHNADAISVAPFKPSNLSGGLAGLGLGFPLAVYLFVGWENSAMLAEETEDPRRNIPRALVIGTVAIGVVYVFLAYATEIGFHNDAKAIAGSTIPFIDALKPLGPVLVGVATLAGLTSIFSCLIGLTNSQARILFNSGREGLLPAVFGKIHPRYGTPHVAMWAYIILALLIVLVFGRNTTPVDLFGDTGSLGTIPIIITYLLTNLALPAYMLRRHRAEFSPFRHAVLPLLGTLLTLLPLWGLIQPGQPWPFSVFPWLVLACLVLSVLYGLVLARLQPDLVSRIGSHVADARA